MRGENKESEVWRKKMKLENLYKNLSIFNSSREDE